MVKYLGADGVWSLLNQCKRYYNDSKPCQQYYTTIGTNRFSITIYCFFTKPDNNNANFI